MRADTGEMVYDWEDANARIAQAVDKAHEHDPIVVCTNATHDHTYDGPSGCPDSIEECSKGCGGYPCSVSALAHGLADLVKSHVALHQQLHFINTAVLATLNTLEEKLDD